MTDARLRALERRWRDTGSVEDEAAWLVERVRAGALDRDRLALAACAAHRPARLALATVGPSRAWYRRMAGPHQTDELVPDLDAPDLLALLGVFSARWSVLAAAAIVRLVEPAWEREERDDPRFWQARLAVEEWLADPTPDKAIQAREAHEALSPWRDHPDSPGLAAARAASWAAATAWNASAPVRGSALAAASAVECAQRALGIGAWQGAPPRRPAAEPHAVLAAVRAVIVEQALATP